MGTTAWSVARKAIAQEIGDWWEATLTSTTTTTTPTDSKLGLYDKDYFKGRWFLWKPGASEEDVRITASATSTGALTVSPALSGNATNADTYDIYRYAPDLYMEAANEAAKEIWGYVFIETHDRTTHATADNQYEYAFPTGAIEICQIWYELDTADADYPYAPMYEGLDYLIRERGDVPVIQFQRHPPVNGTSLNLEVVYVKPLETITSATSTVTATDPDDLYLWYVASARKLMEKLAAASLGTNVTFFDREAARLAAKEALLKGRHRRRWPDKLKLVS